MGNKPVLLIIGPSPGSIDAGGFGAFVSKLYCSKLRHDYVFKNFNTHLPHVTVINNKFVDGVFRLFIKLITFPFFLYRKRPDRVLAVCPSGLGYPEFVYYFIVCKLFGKTTIGRYGGSFLEDITRGRGWYVFPRLLLQCSLFLLDVVIVQSDYWKDAFQSMGVAESKLHIVPNWKEEASVPSGKEPGNTERFVVSFMCGTTPGRKGCFDIADMIAKYAESADTLDFICLAATDVFITYCRDTGVADRITFKPFLERRYVYEILSESDLFILPTYREGFPNILIEAMSLGLPVITTAISALPDIVTDGKNGFLIAPGAIDVLFEKIDLLRNNRVLCDTMGRNNEEKIAGFFSEKIICKRLRSLLGRDS